MTGHRRPLPRARPANWALAALATLVVGGCGDEGEPVASAPAPAGTSREPPAPASRERSQPAPVPSPEPELEPDPVPPPVSGTEPEPPSGPDIEEWHQEEERRARQLRENPVPNPTRLVAGPLLFRLVGTPAPRGRDLSAQVRYALFFRLDKGPKALRRGISSGLFLIADRGIGAGVYRAETHCYKATLQGKGSEVPETAEKLDRLALGTRVRVLIEPLTTTGKPKSSNVYIRHPRLRRTRASLDFSNNLALVIESPSARRALRRIGC